LRALGGVTLTVCGTGATAPHWELAAEMIDRFVACLLSEYNLNSPASVVRYV